MTYKLSDQTIGQIAKCVQIAILTGTDVVDHLRQLQLNTDEKTNSITCDPKYLSTFDKNIENMLKEAQEKQNQETSTDDQLTLF